MKAKQRKLIPAVAMLVVAAVTLTSASYAWFTMSKNVTADGIHLTATAPTNLLIASGVNVWSDGIAGDFDSTTHVKINESNPVGKLNPVSSHDGLIMIQGEDISKINGAGDEKSIFTKLSGTNGLITGSTDGFYVDIPLWLRNTGSEDVYVGVDLAKTAITGTNGQELYKAVRIALLNKEDPSAPKAINSDLIIDAKYSNALDGYLYKQDASSGYVTDALGPIAEADLAKEKTEIWKGSSDTGKYMNTTPGSILCKVSGTTTPNNPSATDLRMYVRIWIEGQDEYCITKNSKQEFDIKIGFTSVTLTEKNS